MASRNTSKGDRLRRMAEKLISEKKLSSTEGKRLLQELQTYQVELEMQNEELRETQEEIETSRSKYVDLYDFSPVGYFSFSRQGKIVEANLTGAGMLGIDRSRLTKRIFTAFVAEEHRRGFRAHLEKCLRTEEKNRCELKLTKKGGTFFYASIESIALKNHENNISIRTAVTDITAQKKAQEEILRLNAGLEKRVKERTAQLEATNKNLRNENRERKRAEEETRRRETEFRAIFELSDVGMAQRDPATDRLIRVNRKLCEITGYSPRELLTKTHHDISHPDDRENEMQMWTRILRGETDTWSIEKRYIRKSGEAIWAHVNGSLVRDESGRPFRTIAVIQDITKRKKAEEALRRAKAELEQKVEERTSALTRANRELAEKSRILEGFFTSTITPIVFLDKNFNVLRVNEAYANCCVQDPSGFRGRNYFELFPHEENEAIFRKVVEKKTPYNAWAQPFAFLAHPERGVTYWDWLLMPVLDEKGEVEYLVLSMNDVSERRQAQQALRESENQLRLLSAQLLTAQENERKRVARELHDGLQQTLTAIKFRVEGFLLQMNKTRMKEKAKTLEPIVALIQESVREIRKIQTNLRPPMLDDLGILASISYLLREFQNTYPDIQIEKRLPIEEPEVPGTLKLVIYRVMQESLNNVGRHSGASLVSILLRKIEHIIELTIRDNGRGFDVGEILTKESINEGMGLASMRERTEASNGIFEVDSAKGKGAVIHASWAL